MILIVFCYDVIITYYILIFFLRFLFQFYCSCIERYKITISRIAIFLHDASIKSQFLPYFYLLFAFYFNYTGCFLMQSFFLV